MTKQEIINNLDLLFSKKEVIEIINKINTSYHTMSFKERKKLLFEFSEIASEVLESYAYTYVNDDIEGELEFSDVVLSNYNDGIAINGVDKNPYIYLKDILFCHLVVSNDMENETIYIGDVEYNSDYTSIQPFIASYSPTNIMYREVIVNKLLSVLQGVNNPYKSDFDLILDCNLTPEMKKELEIVYATLDKYNKEETYDTIVAISSDIEKILIKNNFKNKKYLAMYSINNVLKQCIQLGEKGVILTNLDRFVNTFFPEFYPYIRIEALKSTIKINDIKLKSDDMFLDSLLFAIRNVDKGLNKSSFIITDSQKEALEAKLHKKLTKLEVYFYTKLEELDKLLENRDLEVVNYARYTDIMKFEDDEDIYIDNNRVFEELLQDEDFVRVCNDIVSAKKIDKKMVSKLEQVLAYMNKAYYGADFKLVTNFHVNVNSELGSSNIDTIYLNLANLTRGIDVLNTFFHEYRHLIQGREVKENRGIYNPTLYEYVKKQYIESPFDTGYGYCTHAEAGYKSNINYDLQPIEFDAENFAKYMLVSLSRHKGSPIKVLDSLFNSKYGKKHKCFSNKKISLKYYDYYFKLYKVDEMVRQEEEDYKKLIEAISKIDSVDPEKIFTLSNFDELDLVYKKEVYKKILLNKNDLVLKDEHTISIRGKEISLDNYSEYMILEELLLANALYLAKKGDISMSEMNEYVYNESRKYKIDINRLDQYNLYRIYLYYNTFNKYHLKNQNKNKVKSK